MIDENFIEFCCLDKLVERREAIQVRLITLSPVDTFVRKKIPCFMLSLTPCPPQTAVAKENIQAEEELVEDFGDGYFAPYQQVQPRPLLVPRPCGTCLRSRNPRLLPRSCLWPGIQAHLLSRHLSSGKSLFLPANQN